MIYFGTRLSDNISRREPEGYLICLNVPVARTGIQEYLPEELGLPPGETLIPVHRPEEEVFSPACIASFEGMPVTDDHPAFAEGVNKDNIRYLQKGHAHNIRRGEGKEEDLLLADLIITDPGLSEEIMNGKREISCGYNYTLCEEKGEYVQRDIRGNHIAVVDAGRAGHRVAIRDHAGRAVLRAAMRANTEGTMPRAAMRANKTKQILPVTNSTNFSKNERSNVIMKQRNARYSNARYANAGDYQSGARQADRGFRNYRPARAGYPRGAETRKAARLARVMALMARDGETEELAEMISEIMSPEGNAALPLDVSDVTGMAGFSDDPKEAGASYPSGSSYDPTVSDPAADFSEEAARAIAGVVEQVMEEDEEEEGVATTPARNEPVIMAVPEDRPISIDCGQEILSLLRQISNVLLNNGRYPGMMNQMVPQMLPQMDGADPAAVTAPAVAAVPAAIPAAPAAVAGVPVAAPAVAAAVPSVAPVAAAAAPAAVLGAATAVIPGAVPAASPVSDTAAVLAASPVAVPGSVPAVASAAVPVVAPAAVPAADPTAIPAAIPAAVPAVPASVTPVVAPVVAQSAVPAAVPAVPVAAPASPASDLSVEAVVEAITNAVSSAAGAAEGTDEDPVEALVAEALEEAAEAVIPDNAGGGAVSDFFPTDDPAASLIATPSSSSSSSASTPDEQVLSRILDPEEDCDEQDCDQQDCGNSGSSSEIGSRTEDALRAAMVTFRPILKNMPPAARRQAVERIAANIRAMDRRQSQSRQASGAVDTYAMLKGASRRGSSSIRATADLGRKIMESRNANYRR